jgi:hypothetical protein
VAGLNLSVAFISFSGNCWPTVNGGNIPSLASSSSFFIIFVFPINFKEAIKFQTSPDAVSSFFIG